MSRPRFDLLPAGLNGHRPHRQSSIHVQDWRDQAACAGTDPDDFHPPEGAAGRTKAAKVRKTYCDACPVRLDCLTTAIAESEDRGIWGGCTERERRTLTRLIRVLHPGPDQHVLIRRRLGQLLEGDDTHGTIARHAFGCRCPACRFAAGIHKTDHDREATA